MNEGSFRVTRSRSGTHQIHSVEKPFQLSKSKNGGDSVHNALDSAKSESESHSIAGKCPHDFPGRITRSRTCSEQSTHFRESLEQQKCSKITNGGSVRVTRSRSGAHLFRSVDNPCQFSNTVDGGDGLYSAVHRQVSFSSISAQKDNLMGANTEEYPSKGEMMNDCSGRVKMSQSDEVDSAEGLMKPDKSENVLSGRVAFSRSTTEKVRSGRVGPSRSSPSNKHSQSDTRSDMVERHEVMKAIDTPLIPVPGNGLNGILHPDNCNAVVPDTEFVSSLPAEAFSNCLESDTGNGCRVKEFSFASPPAADDIFVEPKQLFFDEIEDCSLRGSFIPHSDKEKENGSKGKGGSVRSKGKDEFENVTSSSDVKAAQLNVIERPGRSAKRRKMESYESSEKSETKEGDGDMKGGETDTDVSLGFKQTCKKASFDSILNEGESENAHDCLLGSYEGESENAHEYPLGSTGIDATQLASDRDQTMLPGFQKIEEVGSIEGALQNTKSVIGEQLFSHCSASSPDFQDSDQIAANQFIPEFEGFSIGLPSEQISSLSGDRISIGNIDLPTTTERIRFRERLFRSASTLTPLPQYSKHKINRTPDVYQSLPNGLLERIDLRNTLPFCDEDLNQLKASYTLTGAESDLASYSGCLPSSKNGGDNLHSDRSAKRRKTESYESSQKLETKEGDGDMKGVETDTDVSLGYKQTHKKASFDLILNEGESENGHDCLLGLNEGESENARDCPLGLTGMDATQLPSDHDQTMLPCFQKIEELGSIEGALKNTESVIGEQLSSHCSASSPDFQDSDLIAANQFIPEFEGFSIGLPSEQISSLSGDRISMGNIDLPTSTTERISFLERLCRSTSTLTPLPQSSKHKIHRTPDVYQSVPNGLLERIDLRNTLPFCDEDLKQLKASYSLTGAESDLASYSGCMPSSSVQLDWGVGLPPCTPPVRRLGQRIALGHIRHSLEKQHSVNPELTCFRIDEDTSTSEEHMNVDEVVDVSHEGISPRNSISSSLRRPLGDLSNSKILPKDDHERGSLDSMNTDQNMDCTQNNAKKKLRSAYGKDRTKKNKENQSPSLRGNGVGKVSESFHNTTRKLSRKASEGRKLQSFVDKGCKRANIVSNVSSFIPLVQQKQQPSALITGKRDVKVKALETAVAARRLEEKRENERKMKKEAAKLERARLEEERNKQLEIKQKKKEEERKKKEADVAAKLERARLEEERNKQFEMKQKKKEEERKKKEADVAARKRQREEEDRKEKERKRRCIEEARRQQKEQDNLRAEKEEKEQRCRPADEREGKKKYLLNEEQKRQKPAKGSEIDKCMKEMETGSRVINLAVENANKASDICDNSEVLEGYCDKVVRNSSESSNCGFSFTEGCGEQSYEISPYQVSDDEEDEEDVIPNKKFIPSWAREKQLALVLPSLQKINPFEIFCPAKCCSISEVLLPRWT
ncbi:hypothetical protein AQUCO_00500330v1 [Aquilegia coerulea]|uniref:Inner centromere protein ARK-binding domain-containing protein n=1 Tax=Aquilegia coerulea TaxID=218851 RepID=A0A2G5ERG8_AQUCA|nr:hypothetical protein AQUCO_00500330v1 [Aquilegia coerulea]PIA58331.1 hypothetical protein AQUCO_00500330v1 [Aquilegia coerulea]